MEATPRQAPEELGPEGLCLRRADGEAQHLARNLAAISPFSSRSRFLVKLECCLWMETSLDGLEEAVPADRLHQRQQFTLAGGRLDVELGDEGVTHVP